MSIPGSELILFVCAANVCRSPLSEVLLRRGLEDCPEIRVESAGTHARTGAAICSLVADQLSGDGRVDDAQAHRSRPLTAELLGEATLILAADREVRSDVVRMAPQVRDRVYTLREAAYLGDGFSSDASARRVGTVSLYSMHLDGARAAKSPVPARRSRWWRAQVADGRDIVDGHTQGAREHGRTLHDITEASAGILGQLGARAAR